MSKENFDDSTKTYFEHVMDDWHHNMQESDHPYAGNKSWQIRHQALKQWITDLNLSNGRVLEVGCGTGLLQNLVDDYVGIDIALSSKQFMRKPFAACSATRLPFPDNSFDGAWSFWVLEHIPEPENMLNELRRVVKPGGSIFLVAAYGVDSWISQGIHKQPFADLNFKQKFTKLTIPIRASIPFKVAYSLPLRLRDLSKFLLKRSNTKLRYGHLTPNYKKYWDYDADACVSLDSYSVALYFISRGDSSYFSYNVGNSIFLRSQPQAYIVQK